MDTDRKFKTRDYTAGSIPHTPMDELLEAREHFSAEISELDLQMGHRRPVGRVPDAEYAEYREWRSRAMDYKMALTRALRRIRAEVKKRGESARGPHTSTGRRSHEILSDLVLALDGLDLSEHPTISELVNEAQALRRFQLAPSETPEDGVM